MILVVSIAVPSTLGTTLAPNIPVAIAEVVLGTTITGTTELAQGSTTNLSTEELKRSTEDMKLQVSELRKVKEQYANLEKMYDLSKISIVEESREIKGLEKKVKSLENDLTFDKPLPEIRKILRANITQSINVVWPSIQVIL